MCSKYKFFLFFLIFQLGLTPLFADICDVVANGSFEEGLSDDFVRPRYWRIGFPDEAPIDSLGEWSLDSTIFTDGAVSLHLTPHCGEYESYFLTQFLDAPTFDLEGKTVRFSVDMRTDGGAYALLIAYNPESDDSFSSVPVVGYSAVAPSPGDTGFVSLSDSFVATGPAAVMAVMLIVDGTGGGAWFDDVRVEFDVAEAGAGPDTTDVPDPLGGGVRNFYIGVAAEIARNYSEPALQDLPAEIAEVGDIVNIFAHIKWNGLTGEHLLWGHEQQLEIAERAEGLGLQRMLTLDFTHNAPETAGEINPLPDGTPVDSLSPEVRAAYIDELLALIDEIDPIIVSVGIEATLLFDRRPDQWDNYVMLLQEVRDALSDRPEIHITAYAVLSQIVNYDGTFSPEFRSAWEEIMPYCESVAYSFYAHIADTSALPGDYFIKMKEIAPDKPILIPEFGACSDTSQGFSQEVQLQFMNKIVRDVASTYPPPVAVIWYQMYDNLYLGAPDWFKDGFSTVGLRDFAGTPKMTYAAMKKMKYHTKIDGRENIAKPVASISVHPNPFNQVCWVSYRTEMGKALRQRDARILVMDTSGRVVREYWVPRGSGTVALMGDELPSGVYLIKLSGVTEAPGVKVVLVR